jgi:hypothetical protein
MVEAKSPSRKLYNYLVNHRHVDSVVLPVICLVTGTLPTEPPEVEDFKRATRLADCLHWLKEGGFTSKQ